MKISQTSLSLIPTLLLAWLLPTGCMTTGGDAPPEPPLEPVAEDGNSEGVTSQDSPEPPSEPAEPPVQENKWFPYYSNSFSHYDTGDDEPEGLLILDGNFSVAKEGGNKVLTLPAEPLDDFGVLFGPRIPGDVAVQANFLSSKAGRRVPAFSVGLGGVNGFRAKLNLAHRKLQLVKEGEIMGESPFKWVSDEWVTIRIQREKPDKNSDSWIIKVKAWQGEETADWPVVLESDAKQSAGKCSVWGAPYSTKPIHIDDITVFSANALGAP